MKNPKSILITGASSGLGAALAKEYATAGHILFLSGRNIDRLKQVKEFCISKGAKVYSKPVDVSNENAMNQWIRASHHIAPLDLVIANAGISIGYTPTMDLGAHTQHIFGVNINGVLNTVHPAINLMQKRGQGQITIISSLAGYHGLPSAPAYSASKACIKSYGEALRGLYAPLGIEINMVCPGFIKSPMTDSNEFPMPFLMEPEKATKILRRGLEKNQGHIAFPWQMSLLYSFMVRALPEWLFEKILRAMPQKN